MPCLFLPAPRDTNSDVKMGNTRLEARLSRRCLFFTEHQVYIVCRETTGSEAVPSESRSCWISSLLNSSRLDGTLFGPRTSIANGFWRDKLAFSQRTLTYESDILDAFRGILSRSPFVTFWGVPITPPKSRDGSTHWIRFGSLVDQNTELGHPTSFRIFQGTSTNSPS